MNTEKKYQCFRCNYNSDKKCNVISHFTRKKICKRSAICTLTDEQIDLLNKNQFNKNKNKNNNKSDIIIQKQINNINNINITLNIENLTPFNQDWDFSNINKIDEFNIIFSKIMYTELLKLILQNELNMNVIIDEKLNQGIVFTKLDNQELYQEIKIENLVIESMKKLKNHLNIIYDNISCHLKNNIDTNLDVLNEFKNNIQLKFDNFLKEPHTKEIVEKHIIDIYKSKNKKAIFIRNEKENVKLNKIEDTGY